MQSEEHKITLFLINGMLNPRIYFSVKELLI